MGIGMKRISLIIPCLNEEQAIPEFKKELRMNEVYYMLNKALC